MVPVRSASQSRKASLYCIDPRLLGREPTRGRAHLAQLTKGPSRPGPSSLLVSAVTVVSGQAATSGLSDADPVLAAADVLVRAKRPA
jgi:hypothetical protein